MSARTVIPEIGTDFPGQFPASVSASQIVADDVAGLSPENDGFDGLLATALSSIDSEGPAISAFDGDLLNMDFTDGALEGANITPLVADFQAGVTAGDNLNDAATSTLTGQPVQPPSPPPPPQSPGGGGGGGGEGGGGGGGGEGGFCLTDTGEPAPEGSPLCSTF